MRSAQATRVATGSHWQRARLLRPVPVGRVRSFPDRYRRLLLTPMLCVCPARQSDPFFIVVQIINVGAEEDRLFGRHRRAPM